MTEARCTNCGANLEVEQGKKTAKCNYCQSTIIVSNALALAEVEVDHTKDLLLHRENLKAFVKKNSIDEILRVSQHIKDLIPKDFSANYYFAYAKQEGNQPKFMYEFLDNPFEGTDEEIEDVTKHIFKRSDLRDKPKVIGFLNQVNSDLVHEYNLTHSERVSKEDNFADVQRDVFICHSSYDNETAQKVVKELEHDGNVCWISTRNLRPEDSENYWNNIRSAIKSCSIFMVITSENSQISKDVQKELKIAQEFNKPRFEYVIDSSRRTTLFKHVFDGIKWIDGTSNSGNYNKLAERVYDLKEEIEDISNPFTNKMIQPKKKSVLKSKFGLISISALLLATIGYFGYTIFLTPTPIEETPLVDVSPADNTNSTDSTNASDNTTTSSTTLTDTTGLNDATDTTDSSQTIIEEPNSTITENALVFKDLINNFDSSGTVFENLDANIKTIMVPITSTFHDENSGVINETVCDAYYYIYDGKYYVLLEYEKPTLSDIVMFLTEDYDNFRLVSNSQSEGNGIILFAINQQYYNSVPSTTIVNFGVEHQFYIVNLPKIENPVSKMSLSSVLSSFNTSDILSNVGTTDSSLLSNSKLNYIFGSDSLLDNSNVRYFVNNDYIYFFVDGLDGTSSKIKIEKYIYSSNSGYYDTEDEVELISIDNMGFYSFVFRVPMSEFQLNTDFFVLNLYSGLDITSQYRIGNNLNQSTNVSRSLINSLSQLTSNYDIFLNVDESLFDSMELIESHKFFDSSFTGLSAYVYRTDSDYYVGFEYSKDYDSTLFYFTFISHVEIETSVLPAGRDAIIFRIDPSIAVNDGNSIHFGNVDAYRIFMN